MQVLKLFCVFVSSSCNKGNWRAIGGWEVCKGTRASATTSHYYAVSSCETEEIWAQQGESASFPLRPPSYTAGYDTLWKTNRNMVHQQLITDSSITGDKNESVKMKGFCINTRLDWWSLQGFERHNHRLRYGFNYLVMDFPLTANKTGSSTPKTISRYRLIYLKFYNILNSIVIVLHYCKHYGWKTFGHNCSIFNWHQVILRPTFKLLKSFFFVSTLLMASFCLEELWKFFLMIFYRKRTFFKIDFID